MNPIAKALKGKISKAVDKAGNFIEKRVMLQPALDHRRGERADRDREAILRRRESIKNDKEMGY